MVTVGFTSTALMGTEGIPISVCVEVLSGSVQLPSQVNVGLEATDITTTGMITYAVLHD